VVRHCSTLKVKHFGSHTASLASNTAVITCYCAEQLSGQHSSTCPTAAVTGCFAVQQTLHRCRSLDQSTSVSPILFLSVAHHLRLRLPKWCLSFSYSRAFHLSSPSQLRVVTFLIMQFTAVSFSSPLLAAACVFLVNVGVPVANARL